MQISLQQSKINFRSFLWHAVFLALASNFMDVGTIIPSMLIKAGGSAFHLGLLTAIMLGGTSIFQLIFASSLSKKVYKKKFLLIGINLRAFSIIGLSIIFYISGILSDNLIIFLIFLLISIFALSGSYSGVSYNDIFGKSVRQESRKHFFSLKQTINSIGMFFSAFLVRYLIKQFDYPNNYVVLFFCAGFLLLVASAGFWNIREFPSKVIYKKNLIEFFRLIPSEIKKNPNLRNYLLIINSLGLGISILPFLILFAKDKFGLSYELIGNFLVFRTIGMLFASLTFFKISHKINYKTLLKFSLIIGTSLPVMALFFGASQFLYQFLFVLSGVFVAIYKISNNGVLMEISTNENRALYTGISGAGSILIAIFPLIAGLLISQFGYIAVFSSVSLIILSSFVFVNKLNCKKN
ncbi:MAG: MFS transporter [Bacteroidales bacterium]|nr:MFS transporter [Bacteroidales bacterium]